MSLASKASKHARDSQLALDLHEQIFDIAAMSYSRINWLESLNSLVGDFLRELFSYFTPSIVECECSNHEYKSRTSDMILAEQSTVYVTGNYLNCLPRCLLSALIVTELYIGWLDSG